MYSFYFLRLQVRQNKSVAILDSAYRGGHYSKITFIVRPLHITLHFLHLCTLKIGLKLHVCVPKILGLAMPVHMSTFHQDFPQLIFYQGGPWPPLAPPGPPLKSPMKQVQALQQQFSSHFNKRNLHGEIDLVRHHC